MSHKPCNRCPGFDREPLTRRELLWRAGGGLGGVALTWLLSQAEGSARPLTGSAVSDQQSAVPGSPYAARPSHFPARAKRVIQIFACGGVSHVDAFDCKPELARFDGKPMTGKGPVDPFFGEPGNLMKNAWEFRRRGESGLWISDLLPHLATCADDLTLFNAMVARNNNHTPATFMMNSGFTFNGFPAMGSWVSYGLDDPVAGRFARNCLLARRLVERGVRFVQLYHGGAFGSPRVNWDAHEDLRGNHGQEAGSMDRPVAGLLKDLKQRGLLDETLVVWCTEFGRTPFTQGLNRPGRDHHQLVFSCWMAGAGLKHGIAHGESDEVGYAPGRDPVTVHDFHATILHLLGMDHRRLTFYHNGIQRRLTDVAGEVVRPVLA